MSFLSYSVDEEEMGAQMGDKREIVYINRMLNLMDAENFLKRNQW